MNADAIPTSAGKCGPVPWLVSQLWKWITSMWDLRLIKMCCHCFLSFPSYFTLHISLVTSLCVMIIMFIIIIITVTTIRRRDSITLQELQARLLKEFIQEGINVSKWYLVMTYSYQWLQNKWPHFKKLILWKYSWFTVCYIYTHMHTYIYVYIGMPSRFSYIWLCNPMDCSLLGPSVRGISQTRIVE